MYVCMYVWYKAISISMLMLMSDYYFISGRPCPNLYSFEMVSSYQYTYMHTYIHRYIGTFILYINWL